MTSRGERWKDETARSRTRTAGARRWARTSRASSGWAIGLLLCGCGDRAGDAVTRAGSDAVASVQLRAPAPVAEAREVPASLTSVEERRTPGSVTTAEARLPAAALDEPAQQRVGGVPVEARPELLAPGASEEFDASVLADVKVALNAVEEAAFATLVHGDKRVLPNSCRSWRALRARGFAPKSALGAQRDAGALVRCGSLEFLARAKPSRVSYVRNALDGAEPKTLPAILASTTSKLALQARNVAVAKGLSLGQFLPDARTGNSELRGRVLINEPASATSVIVNAEVWGDINADAIEDLLLSVLNSNDDISYLDVRLIQVTRTARDAPLIVLAVSE